MSKQVLIGEQFAQEIIAVYRERDELAERLNIAADKLAILRGYLPENHPMRNSINHSLTTWGYQLNGDKVQA